MGRVRIMAQSIEEEHIETGESFEAFVRNIAVVSEIGAISETEAVDYSFAMADSDGRDLEIRHDNGLVIKEVGRETGSAGFAWAAVEDVLKRTLDHGPGIW